MKYEEIVKELRAILSERFPGKYNYVPELARILEVHPKTIYRKLRGDTEFSFLEIVKISKALDMSMEPIFAAGENTIKHPMEIYLQDFSAPMEFQKVVGLTLQAYDFAAESASSIYMAASNTVPDVVSARYEWIARFSYAKWLYYNKGARHMVNLSEVYRNPKDQEIHKKYWDALSRMKRSMYVFTMDMMKNITEQLSFFYMLNYINREEILLILADFKRMLTELEQVCVRGYTLAGKEVSVFYSNVILTNDMTVLDSDNIQLGIIYAYYFNPIVTKSRETFEIVKNWFRSWIRSSSIISMSGTMERNAFFSHQHEVLEELENRIKNGTGYPHGRPVS